MANRSRKRSKRGAMAAIAAGAPASRIAAIGSPPIQAEPDIRRTLPTQDWIAKVDPAQLSDLVNSQKLAVTHFYNGLVQVRNNFVGNLLLPPDQNQLARELHGTVLMPDGTTPASLLAVSVLPVTDASNNAVQIPQTAVTNAQGQFVLRNLPSVSVLANSTISLSFRGANAWAT
jgi:hypothetical protein